MADIDLDKSKDIFTALSKQALSQFYKEREQICLRIRNEVIRPFCKKHKAHYISGMGTYRIEFDPGHLIEQFGNDIKNRGTGGMLRKTRSHMIDHEELLIFYNNWYEGEPVKLIDDLNKLIEIIDDGELFGGYAIGANLGDMSYWDIELQEKNTNVAS